MSNKALVDKLKKKRKELTERGSKGGVIYLKEGTARVRLLPASKDDIAIELTHFYLNEKLKGVYSAASFNEDCPILEAYQELKKSKDDDDQELAKKLTPKQAYMVPVVMYADEKGNKIDTENSGKLMKIPGGVYQSIIDLYLDEDDWGDMTDPKKGYDIKITRTGKTKNDTEYSVAPCKNTPLDKDWAKKTIDLKAMAKSLVEPYDVVKGKLNEFLGIDDEDEDEDKPRKKSKKAKDDFSTAKKKKSVKTGKKVLTKKKK